MLDQLLQWDQILFYSINGSNLPFIDELMPYYRHKLFWAPLYLFLVSFIVWNFPKNGLWMLLFAVLTVGISDTVSSKFIKKSVKRVRPCNDSSVNQNVHLRVRCGGGYSFTSSHATNHAAIAFYIYFLFRQLKKKWMWLLPLWAITIGLAQIYVGVHYPLDVLAGLGVGTAIGMIMAFILRSRYQLE